MGHRAMAFVSLIKGEGYKTLWNTDKREVIQVAKALNKQERRLGV